MQEESKNSHHKIKITVDGNSNVCYSTKADWFLGLFFMHEICIKES